MPKRSEYIRPSMAPVPGFTKLSPLDQVMVRVFLPQLLMFPISSPSQRPSIVSNLKAGLALTLDEIPIFAGKVITEDPERRSIQIEVPDDAGVWFHVEELPTLDFNELEKGGFQLTQDLNSKLLPVSLIAREGSPVLAIQANFITSGLILTLNMHHSAMDGISMMTFIRTFAKHVAAVSEGRVIGPEDMLSEEALDRSVLLGGNSRSKLTDFPSYRSQSQDRNVLQLFNKMLEMVEKEEKVLEFGGVPLPATRISYWRISKESLQTLREEVEAKSSSMVLTENEMLCAYIWQHLTRARLIKERGIKESMLSLNVDARARLDPPLPADYIGNAIIYTKLVLPIDEVISSPLQEIAEKISDSVRWWTADRIWDFLGAVEAWPDLQSIERAMDSQFGPDLDITSTASARMRYFYWGRGLGVPTAFRLPNIPALDGLVQIWPKLADGSLDLLLFMEEGVLSRLRNDNDWMKRVREIC